MTLIAGIDPGTHGAIVIYNTDTGRLSGCWDMPIWYQTVNKKSRPRVDPVALKEIFDELVMYGVTLCVLEAVGGRPQQSASAGFVFGYTVGLVYMSIIHAQIAIETVPPKHWKKILNVSGKAKAEDDDILNRANELFPHDRDLFICREKSDKGRKRVDRAEAAMLAKFGGDHVLRTLTNSRPNDVEAALAYRNADLAA